MNAPFLLKETFVIVASEEAKDLAQSDGYRFVGVIDPSGDASQIMRGDAVRSEWSCFEKFVLVLPHGCEDLRDDLAIRLGDERCLWVMWSPGENTIRTAISSARSMWTDEIATLDDIPDEGPQKVYKTGFPLLDQHGLRITLPAFVPLIGPYGSGKSVFLRQLLINLWRMHGWKFAITSFEERVKPTYHRDFRRHLIAKPVERWTDEDKARADIEINQSAVFLRRPRGGTYNADALMRQILFAVRVHGCRVIAIDPVNEIEHQPDRGESKTDYMGRFIMNLKRVADDYGLLIVVAAHPAKAGVEKRSNEEYVYTLNDGADTAHWGNKADIGLCVWRLLKGPTMLHVEKLKVHEVNGKPCLAEMILDPALGKFNVARIGYEILGDHQ